MPKTILAVAAALLISAGATLAQPPGITPEMINRSLPLEGAPLAVPGPYKVASEAAFGSPGLHVYRPEALEAFPKKLRGLPEHHRFARLSGDGHGSSGGRGATAGIRR